jgi:RimJ/RimL family protein N-acetyltransferase
MFARTPRLILRPAWPEDAPRLAAALNDPAIARSLAKLPSPYSERDARAWIGEPGDDPRLPRLLAFMRTRGAPRLVGGCDITRKPDGGLELGYWIDRRHWGLGFATEATRAVIAIARAAGLGALRAVHFSDAPASGRVLRKLGFKATGRVEPRWCEARQREVDALIYEDSGKDLGLTEVSLHADLYSDAWDEEKELVEA